MDLADLIMFGELFAELNDNTRQAVLHLMNGRLDAVTGYQCLRAIAFFDDVLTTVETSDSVEKEIRDARAYAELKV